MKSITSKIKEEKVTVVAVILAAISMFFVKPDNAYISYIDVKTIVTLFVLMLVVSILRAFNVFFIVGQALVSKATDIRSLAIVFILLNFFLSMFITNDVALITFVPFTIEVLMMTNKMDYLIDIVALETIAANLGSCMTPIGNPQNIYLYGLAGLNIDSFLKLMLPYGVASIILLFVFIFILFKKEKVSVLKNGVRIGFKFNLIDILAKVDYFLLLTFVFLFIFIGNVSRIERIKTFLSSIIVGREILVSVLSSQIISNVPAAILLSKFTTNYKDLLVGVNIGGLGTIIASMASLISYKFYAKTKGANVSKYLLRFTLYNLIFLALLILINLF